MFDHVYNCIWFLLINYTFEPVPTFYSDNALTHDFQLPIKPFLLLSLAVEADGVIAVCPILLTTHAASGLPYQTFLILCHIQVASIFRGKTYRPPVTERRAGRATECSVATSTLGWISNYCFSIMKRENIVGAELYAAGLSGLGATITLIRINYREPRAIIRTWQIAAPAFSTMSITIFKYSHNYLEIARFKMLG